MRFESFDVMFYAGNDLLVLYLVSHCRNFIWYSNKEFYLVFEYFWLIEASVKGNHVVTTP